MIEFIEQQKRREEHDRLMATAAAQSGKSLSSLPRCKVCTFLLGSAEHARVCGPREESKSRVLRERREAAERARLEAMTPSATLDDLSSDGRFGRKGHSGKGVAARVRWEVRKSSSNLSKLQERDTCPSAESTGPAKSLREMLHARETAGLAATYCAAAPAEAICRHLAVLGWCLKASLRAGEDDSDVVSTMLPPATAETVLAARKRPVALLRGAHAVVAEEVAAGRLDAQAHLSLLTQLHSLNARTCVESTSEQTLRRWRGGQRAGSTAEH